MTECKSMDYIVTIIVLKNVLPNNIMILKKMYMLIIAALFLLTIIKLGYMESRMKISVTYLNSIHLATKFITLFNIVKHSMNVFTSTNKVTSICVNCSRNNSRPFFINIIVLSPQLTHRMDANVEC